MNKQKKLFSHLRQKENKRLKRNWHYFHRWRKNIDPSLFARLCGGSCLNCKHCVLDDKMRIWCEENEYMRECGAYACNDHEPSKTNWLEKGHSYFDIKEYEA